MTLSSNRIDAPARHRGTRLALAAAGSLLMLDAAALAGSTEWVETEAGRIRVTALAPAEDGTIRGVLDVDLLPGWKTYWRDPGDAGVPPSVNIEDSINIGSARLDFPPPERIDDGYSVWAGYDAPVAFPLTLGQQTPGRKSRLEATVFIGLCETVCIPFQTHFSLTIEPDHAPSPLEVRIVDRAYADIPEPHGHGFDVLEGRLSEHRDRVSISVAHPVSRSEPELFLTAPAGWYFDVPERVAGEEHWSTFDIGIIHAPENGDLSGKSLQLLVKSANRSMETQFELP